MLPNDFTPWEAVYQQSRLWLEAGSFEAMVMVQRSMIRFASGRRSQPDAVVLNRRTLTVLACQLVNTVLMRDSHVSHTILCAIHHKIMCIMTITAAG